MMVTMYSVGPTNAKRLLSELTAKASGPRFVPRATVLPVQENEHQHSPREALSRSRENVDNVIYMFVFRLTRANLARGGHYIPVGKRYRERGIPESQRCTGVRHLEKTPVPRRHPGAV